MVHRDSIRTWEVDKDEEDISIHYFYSDASLFVLHFDGLLCH
jgi:hypothetical protein